MEEYFSHQEYLCRQHEISSFSDILDDIGDMKLLNIAKSFDSISIFIILNLINGYSTKEIAEMLNVTSRAVNLRLQKIRKKVLAINNFDTVD